MTRDVIIIGGGIIGCTLAVSLGRRGLRPVIVEASRVGTGTTGNSFAWANATTKTRDAAYHRLNADGVTEYARLAAEFGTGATGLNPAGAMQVVRRADVAGFRAMQADARALADFGYPCTWLDHAALTAEAPGLTFAPDCEALLSPSDIIVDAPRFARFMADRAVAAGGALREQCRAQTLIADDDGQVRGVETSGGRLKGAHVVVATGADTGAVLSTLTGYDAFATRFPLRLVPGLLLTTPPLAPMPLNRLIFSSTTEELHLLPAPNGGLRIGSDDVDGMIYDDRNDTAKRAAGQRLLKRAAGLVPGLDRMVRIDDCALQIGIRPYPEDGRSIAGPLPGADGLSVIATHSGITLAPAIAPLMAEFIDTGRIPAQLAPFGLERFPGFAG